MVTWEVTIDGTPVDAINEVQPTSGDEGKLGTCTVVCGATATNRSFDSGDDATVRRNGTVQFKGKLSKAPIAGAQKEQIEFVISDSRIVLRYIESHRPFYQMDTGAIIREAITQESKVKSPVTIAQGDDLSNWSTDIQHFELLESDEKRIHNRGSDAIFAGWEAGSSGTYSMTYDAVPSAAIPGDGQIVRLTTRLLVNNRGDQINAEVDLRDNAGNNYIWPLETRGTDFSEVTLAAEDAVTTATIGTPVTTNGTLEYRFKLKGSIPDPRAVGLDYSETLPFTLQARNPDITVNNVQNTGNVVTRRFEENVMQMLATLGDEDGYDSWIDDAGDLHYEPGAGRGAPLQITDATPVTDYEFNRDYDQITNKVTIQGAENIQTTAVDNASIQFYGLSEREQQIVQEEMQTQQEVDRKAREFLEEHAWSDTAIVFEVADVSYGNVSVGEGMRVQWSPENVDEIYTVEGKEIDSDGFVTLSFSGNTGA